jgi:ribosomal protein S18 acetylase RimI-like enzyme
MQNIIVRRANKSDINALSHLHQALINYHIAIDPIHNDRTARSLSKKTLTEQLSDKRFQIFVAIIEDKIVGHIIIQIKDAGLGHIWEVYVDPFFRTSGTGSKLIQEAVVWLEK